MTPNNIESMEKDFWTEMNTGEQEKFVLETKRLKKDISFGVKLSTPPPHKQTSMDWEKELCGLLYDEYGDVGKNGNIKSFIEKTLTQARREEKQSGRISELDVLRAHLDRQIYERTINVDSVYKYLDEREEHIKNNLTK